MSNSSTIEWTDATWNPTTGCTRVSAGCDNCYAALMSRRLEAMGQQKYAGVNGRGHFNGQVKTHEGALDVPQRIKRPSRIFVNSMSDLFHREVPFEFVDRVFDVIAYCRRHTFQVLTKRPDRMAQYTAERDVPDNAWLGTSVESAEVHHRIESLAACRARVLFLSVEPLIGNPGDLRPGLDLLSRTGGADRLWVIVGGESGPGSRPMQPEWARLVRDACLELGVAFFFKQWGDWVDGRRAGKKAAGRLLDGRQWNDFPVAAQA